MAVLRWFLLVGAVLGAMVAASVLSTPTDWPAAVAWADEQVARWHREARECPVLHGTPLPGSSRAGYVEAARLAGALPKGQQVSLRDLSQAAGEVAEPTEAERLALDALAPAVQTLRDAAHRSAEVVAAAAPAGVADASYVLELSDVVDALLVEGRQWARRGHLSEAVECLLDGLACGADLTNGRTWLEVGFGAFTVERFVDAFTDELLQECDAALLAKLAEALARADGALPSDCRLLQHCVEELVHHLRDAPSVTAADLGMATPLLAWRHGFSVRESGKARAAELVAIVKRFVPDTMHEEPWPVRKARLAAAVAEERAQNWDLRWGFLFHVVKGEQQVRETVARLRLLRLAVAFRLGGAVPALRDPLGDGDLRASVDGDRATFAVVDGSAVRTSVRRR